MAAKRARGQRDAVAGLLRGVIVAAERLADKEHVAAQRVAVLAERAEFGVHIRAKQGEAVRRGGASPASGGRPGRLPAATTLETTGSGADQY